MAWAYQEEGHTTGRDTEQEAQWDWREKHHCYPSREGPSLLGKKTRWTVVSVDLADLAEEDMDMAHVPPCEVLKPLDRALVVHGT